MAERVVIWDWNGTLLNDLTHCVSSINKMLGERSKPELTVKKYKEIFTFPIRNYYEAAGFDFSKEDFETPALEFIDIYGSGIESCALHDDVPEVLGSFSAAGVRQFVLSAMEQEMLERTLKHNGIFHFFEGVAGLGDHFAVSKVERGKQLFSEFGINPENARMFGDTIHDFEVARELGIRCTLVANGHQSKERLEKTGAPVVERLAELHPHFIP